MIVIFCPFRFWLQLFADAFSITASADKIKHLARVWAKAKQKINTLHFLKNTSPAKRKPARKLAGVLIKSYSPIFPIKSKICLEKVTAISQPNPTAYKLLMNSPMLA
jgi:hypothetical protein